MPPDFVAETSSADVITPEGYSVKLVCRYVRICWLIKQKGEGPINKTSCVENRRARGNPEPIVTWRREDGEGIAVKDGMGGKQLGKETEKNGWPSVVVGGVINWPFGSVVSLNTQRLMGCAQLVLCLLQFPLIEEKR